MIYRIFWLIVLAGTMCRCGGSAFTSSDPPPDLTPDAPAPALDGGAEIAVIVAEAGPETATLLPDAAPTPDAAQVPESRAPAPDVCVPTSGLATPSPCPSTCLGGCAGQHWPDYFFLVSQQGCGAPTTPPECLACGSYTCTCIVAARSWCVGGGLPTCYNETGIVTLVCP